MTKPRIEPISAPTLTADHSATRARRGGSWFFAEYNLRGMRRYIDIILAEAIGLPMIYIATLGVGLGAILMGSGTSFGGVPYITFIAGALMAVGAVDAAMIEMMFPVMAGFKWQRTYYAPQVTPISPQQIARGAVLSTLIRVFLQSLIFLAIVAAFGAVHAWTALWALVFSTIAGLAFGIPCMAYAAGIYQERGQFSVVMRFIFMPMFLFSGTFYPLSQLPGYLQWIGWISPIWHGTELNRWAIYGHPVHPLMFAVHILFLLALCTWGFAVAQGRYARRLRGEDAKARTWGARRSRKAMANTTSEESTLDVGLGQTRRAARAGWSPSNSQPKDCVETDTEANAGSGPKAHAAPSDVSQHAPAQNVVGHSRPRRWLGHLYGRNARAVMERSWMATKNATWMVIVTGFAEPVLYLASLGLGLGAVVGGVEGPGGATMTYASFIAPGLLGVSAMNGALMDTNNMFFKLRFAKLYRVMLHTSLGPLDVAIGEISMAMARGFVYAVGFYIIAAFTGLVSGWAGLLMIPAAVLIALSFASVFMGIVTFMKRFQHLDWLNFVIQPLTLFSATFYPLSVYPGAVQNVIMALPLWQGVDLLRMLAMGAFEVGILWHLLYFVVMTSMGLILATRRLQTMFLK